MRSPQDAARLGIAVIHQELEIIDNLDVAGNVFLGREPTGAGWLKLLDRRAARDRTREHLAKLGAGIARETPLRTRCRRRSSSWWPSRERYRCRRASSIMDEPTSSLTLSDTERADEGDSRSARRRRRRHLHLAPPR